MRLTHTRASRRSGFRVAFLLGAVLVMCTAVGGVASQTVERNFDFRSGALGWTADFAGYPPWTNTSGFYQLHSGIRYAPRKLTRVPIRAFYIQGTNYSGQLTMFLKRRLTTADGIVPGRSYRIEYVMRLASQAATGCIGIGAPPGEGVFLRAGGSPLEPVAKLQSNGWLTTSIDIPAETSPAGNIANGVDCEIAYPTFPFIYINRSVQHSVTASPQGDLWLFISTTSGFEGPTRLFYQQVNVKLIPN